MHPKGFSREKVVFIEDHPIGAAVTDIKLAAALLCCEDVEIAELRDNPRKKNEVIFVLKGDSQLISKRALQFFKGRIDGAKLEARAGGMAAMALFSQKVRELMMGVKNGIRGKLTAEDLAEMRRMADSEAQNG